MATRTQKPDSQTRTALLDAAEELMLGRGYVAATVDAICAAAELTKGSFFHYFRNKEDLGKALLERFAERQLSVFLDSCSKIEDPLERVYCVIDCVIQGFGNPEMKGCLVGTFAQEISETHPDLRSICKNSFESFSKWMAEEFQTAKVLYAPNSEFDANSLGEHFLSIAQGSMLLFKTNGNRGGMEQNMIHFRNYVKALYGR